MAITYTENYHLGKQEDHTDKFDMDVITENADKIDEALSGMQSDLDAKGTYSKPSGGIPKTDLTSAVQESLNKADGSANGTDFNKLMTIVAGGNTKTATGTSSITMTGTFGKPIAAYQISGKTYQNGNPSPTNPIDVQGVGDIMGTPVESNYYKIPINSASVISNVIVDAPLYGNSSVQDSVEYSANDSGTITRRWGIKVFDGTENWVYSSEPDWVSEDTSVFYVGDYLMLPIGPDSKDAIVSHFETYTRNELATNKSTEGYAQTGGTVRNHSIRISKSRVADLTAFKSWLASQYAAGTPLTVVYRLATPTTENIELPELPTAQASRIIDGATTALTVETSVAPTRITAVYKSINE